MVPKVQAFHDAYEKLDVEHVKHEITSYCTSVYGSEHVKALEPSAIFAEVRDEYLKLREIMGLCTADDPPPVEELPDCREALHRGAIEASALTGEEFHGILKVLVASRSMSQFFTKRRERSPLLSNMAEALFHDKMLEYHIDRTITDEGEVRDSASRELLAIRKQLIEKTSQLRRRMEALLKRSAEEQLVQEELVTLRNGRMVLPVKAEFKRQIQGFVHGASSTGQTVYIEPTETLELNNEITDLQFEEQREVSRILAALTDKLRPGISYLLSNLEVLGEMDSVLARVKYAMQKSSTCPIVKLNGPLHIYAGRHPLLLERKKFDAVVPLDITLGDPETTILITGPNAGGKSVAMKTVGLLCLLVQSGIPVPCSDFSEFPVYNDVLVDIGDEQSVENDLSTFSSHIHRLARIVDVARADTLALIDEIGTGTDPAEGSALGAAILEYLTSAGVHVIATTHHGMLKALAHEHPMMKNAAMEFDTGTLQPTYRFRPGFPGSSYAFEITKRHGLKPELIERARELSGSAVHSLESLLTEVEKKASDLNAELREAESVKSKYINLRNEYEEKLADAKTEMKQMRKQALVEAQQLVESANARIEQTIMELRSHDADHGSIQDAHATVGAVRLEIEKELTESEPQQKSTPAKKLMVHKDCTVVMPGNPDVPGTVLEEPQGGKAIVLFGSMRMTVPVKDLQVTSEAPTRSETVSTHFHESERSNEIDLRGKYGDEAVDILDKYLYDAYTAGLHRVDVIHGKGTGALRKRIHTFLKDLSIVESWRLGEWHEGSYGVTVVFLKN